MAGDFARWLATETAATLKHDLRRPADPFDCIQDGSSEYEDTILETTAERARREEAAAASPERKAER